MGEVFLIKSRRDIICSFCVDVAKGLTLAALIGQGMITEAPGNNKLAISALWIIFSFWLLIVAFYFKRKGNE